MTKRRVGNESGFHVIELLIVLAVIAVVGFVGWKVMAGQRSKDKGANNNSSQVSKSSASTPDVVWMWGGDKWLVQNNATPPSCGDGPELKMPVDINKVTSVLYPGQQRSTGYKPHGGFLFGDTDNEAVDVTVPADSHLIKASRYIEAGETQYFMVFTLPCGFAYRFDHLRTLTPEFQAIMDKLPEPKVDDSRTTPIDPAIAFKAGTKVATGVGFVNTKRASVDFGLYDLRQQNKASKDANYASEHADEKEFSYYGVCFFDYFSKDAAVKLRSLPAADQTAGKTSDYCN